LPIRRQPDSKRERVLERVGSQFVDDEAAGHSRIYRQRDIVYVHVDPDGVGAQTIRARDVGHELLEILSEVDARQVFRLIKRLVDQSHRFDAILAVLEDRERLLVAPEELAAALKVRSRARLWRIASTTQVLSQYAKKTVLTKLAGHYFMNEGINLTSQIA
jgi:hypothetical protein